MDASSPSCRCSTRPSACRCRCCSPASPGSIPSAPASSTSGSKARCWSAPSPRGRGCRSPARPGSALRAAIVALGRLRAGPRLCLDHPSRQPDRLRRRDQFPRRRARPRARPGLVRAGRPHARSCNGARASRPITCPAPKRSRTCRSSARSMPSSSPATIILVYRRLRWRCRSPGGCCSAPASACGCAPSAKTRPPSTPPASRSPGCATGRVICTGVLCGIAGAYLSIAQSAGFMQRHDRRQGLYRARGADLRQVAAGAGAVRLPAVRLPRRLSHPPAGHRRCR